MGPQEGVERPGWGVAHTSVWRGLLGGESRGTRTGFGGLDPHEGRAGAGEDPAQQRTRPRPACRAPHMFTAAPAEPGRFPAHTFCSRARGDPAGGLAAAQQGEDELEDGARYRLQKLAQRQPCATGLEVSTVRGPLPAPAHLPEQDANSGFWERCRMVAPGRPSWRAATNLA